MPYGGTGNDEGGGGGEGGPVGVVWGSPPGGGGGRRINEGRGRGKKNKVAWISMTYSSLFFIV